MTDPYLEWVSATRAWWCDVCQRLTALTPEHHIHDQDQSDE